MSNAEQPKLWKAIFRLPKTWKQATPNLLTIFRLLAGPVIFACLWNKDAALAWVVLFLFAAAALTDYLDGFLARLWQTQSWLGQVLDPIADKLLVASVLVGLIAFRPTNVLITVVVYILLMRELLVSGLREVSRETLAVSLLGKSKTMMQMVALFVLLAENAAGWALNIGYYLLSISMVLSLLSLAEYSIRMVKERKMREQAVAFSKSS